MVKDMDVNADRIITENEFVDYRARQFAPADKDKDGYLDAKEFPHPGAFKGGDKNQDGKLSPEEHLNIFRSQFAPNDTNKDGVITANDKKPRQKGK